MVKTDKLIFLALQKTACTAIERLLVNVFDGDNKSQKKHDRLQFDPQGRHVFGSVRNPWDWYASLWSFGCMNRGGIYFRLSTRGRIKKDEKFFRKHIYNLTGQLRFTRMLVKQTLKPSRKYVELYRDYQDPKLFREWLKVVLNPGNDALLHQCYALGTAAKVLGLFSFRYLWLFSRDIERIHKGPDFANLGDVNEFFDNQKLVDSLVRLEHLEADLVNTLELSGYDLNNALRASISESLSKKQNKSKRLRTAELFDEETSQLVAERERFIIDRHDYSEPRLM